ncbi:MAG: hypothetical protein JW863_20935 [Chitinispirillaceae bacterium]|nr:hypothetical protein [Chitinispirillaceae bacterium]
MKTGYTSVAKILTGMLLISIMTLFAVDCNRDTGLSDLGGSSESTSANVCGTVYNSDGTPAEDAIIRFIPADYNAYSSNPVAEIESTQTSGDGTFAFELKENGFYNIDAQKNTAKAFMDSIYVSTDNRTRVNDTLKVPGSISGTARLEEKNDSAEIIILVIGTNTYTVPEDTMGAFSLPDLAEGEYLLRFLTTHEDYGYVDTLITVVSGETTEIEEILYLPYLGVPNVGALEIHYDTNMMFATLSWPKADTSRVGGFYVYEHPSYTDDPYAILENTDTTFIADAIGFSGFAFPVSYSLMAVGKDRSIGKPSTSSEFYAENMFLPIDTIRCLPMTENAVLAVNGANGNTSVYLAGPGWIAKYADNGDRTGEYVNDVWYGYSTTDQWGNEYSPVYYSHIAVDNSGVVYAVEVFHTGFDELAVPQTDSVTLTKFTPDLDSVTTVTITRRSDSIAEDIIPFKAVADEEHIHLFFRWADGSLTGKMIVRTLDAALTETESDTFPEFCSQPEVLLDTIYTAGQVPNRNFIVSYDMKGNKVGEWNIENMESIDYPGLKFHDAYSVLRFASGSMLIGTSIGGVLTDAEFKCIGRGGMKINTELIGSDGVDRVYIKDDSMNANSRVSYANIIVFRLKCIIP